MRFGSLLNVYIDLIGSISFDKNTGGDHPDISPASPGTFDLHLDTQDFFISKDKLDNFALCSIRLEARKTYKFCKVLLSAIGRNLISVTFIWWG